MLPAAIQSLYPKLSPWLLLGLSVGILFNGVYSLFLWYDPGTGAILTETKQTNQDKTGKSQAFPMDLTRFHLMGQVQAITATTVQSPVASSNTLNVTQLSLQGIWQPSMAFIRLPNAEERVFKLGDEIVSGIRLRSIHPDHVVLEQTNGQTGVLSLPKESLVFEPVETVEFLDKEPNAKP